MTFLNQQLVQTMSIVPEQRLLRGSILLFSEKKREKQGLNHRQNSHILDFAATNVIRHEPVPSFTLMVAVQLNLECWKSSLRSSESQPSPHLCKPSGNSEYERLCQESPVKTTCKNHGPSNNNEFWNVPPQPFLRRVVILGSR